MVTSTYPFLTMFYTQKFIIRTTFVLFSENASNLIQSLILSLSKGLTLYHTMTLRKRSFENNVGQGENDGNQHFLLFP